MTQLIICEKYRIARAVAKALKATRKLRHGVYASDEITVAFVRKDFIKPTPLSDMADGRLPFVPAKYKMSVNDKVTDRRLKRLFRNAREVIFASGEGAEAQARFFNLCRHFRVGQPTSRMWLTSLDYQAIRQTYAKREKGRVLHDLAQAGLVNNGMELLFGYNFSRVLDLWYYHGKSLTRQETIAMSFLGDVFNEYEEYINGAPQYRITLDCGGLCLTSDKAWNSQGECKAVLDTIETGVTVKAEMTVKEVTNPALSPQTMITLQMDAFDNLGYMPVKTIAVANRLYERGIITSPYTHNPDMGIMPLRPLPPYSSENERKLYDMIAGRMEAVTLAPETRQVATIKAEIAGVIFSYTWEIKEPKPGYIGTSRQEFTIEGTSVVPVERETPHELFGFSAVLYNLQKILAATDTYGHARMPYSGYDHEWGTAIEGLAEKGFIAIDSDGIISLTDEGRRLAVDIEPYDLFDTLRNPDFSPNAVLLGDLKGRQAIANFEKWLTATVGDILKYVPKEDNGDTPKGEISDEIPALSEK